MTVDAADLKQADTAYREGRFAQAEQAYREVLARTPKDAHAWAQLGTIALWKNDLVSARSCLQKARQHRSWFGRRWPFSATLNTRLAIAHGRGGELRAAAGLLRRASGWAPFGPFRELRVRAQQLELFKDRAPYRIEGPGETRVPFVVTDPLPVVAVSVNGAEPANFFIDTGGEGIILDHDYARKAGATLVGDVAAEYAGAKRGRTGYGMVERVAIGGTVVRHLPITTIDMQPISKTVFPGLDIKGIIGTGFLFPFLATIDYPGRQLVLRRPAGSVDDVDRMLALTGQDLVLPVWLVETHLVFAIGSVNGRQPGLMFIDTGLANAGFHTSQKIFHEAGVAMDWSKAETGAGGGGMTRALQVSVAEVSLGSGDNAVRKRNLRGIVFAKDISLFTDAMGFRVEGLISHQFFRDHALTFDFANMRIILQQRT